MMAPRNHEGGDSPRAASSSGSSSFASSSPNTVSAAAKPRSSGGGGSGAAALSRLPPVPAEALALARAGSSASGDSGHFVPSTLPVSNVPRVAERYTGLLGEAFKRLPLLQRLDWKHVILLGSTPIIAIAGALTWTFNWRTFAFAVFYYFVTGLGITAGYHRHFAHRAYDATPACKLLLLLMAAGAVEGSCRWWSRGHRAHHRYVDTDRDPYAVVYGFWHAHVGWMLVRQDPEKIGHVDVDDLEADPLVGKRGLFNRFYMPIALLMAFVLPTLVCGLGWGDWHGGYFIAGVARLVFVHHSTFFVNSLAHYAGDALFTDGHTARNSFITALLTLGEGYHNFHHEFPSDYRNGVMWYQYDPTKVFIYCLSLVGLAYNLKQFPQNEIDKGMLQMRQRELNALKRGADWGPDPAALPYMSRKEFAALTGDGGRGVRSRELVILDGFVLDVARFAPTHPGGPQILRSKIGKDVSLDFSQHERPFAEGDPAELARPQSSESAEAKAAKATKAETAGAAAAPVPLVIGTYKHSNAARSLAETLRVARIEGYVLPRNSTAASVASAMTGGFALAAEEGKRK